MSKDKRKKHLRAMAFLRHVNAECRPPYWGSNGRVYVNRKLSRVMRYCIDRGLAQLRREERGGSASRTVFDTGLHDR
ncbi:hypothetical protein ACVWW6_006004 [Bradyrhizobium sp. USDA 3311]